MRKGGGHEKGAEFERSIAKTLSKWASNGTQTDVFWRAPSSGARARVVGSKARAHAGDITSTHELGHAFIEAVIIECKHYSKIDWRHLLIEAQGEFFKFWNKLYNDSIKFNQHPLLVVKENGRHTLIVTNQNAHLPLFGPVKAPVLITASYPYLRVFTFEQLLAQPYSDVIARLEEFRKHDVAHNKRLALNRPPRARVPTGVPGVVGHGG